MPFWNRDEWGNPHDFLRSFGRVWFTEDDPIGEQAYVIAEPRLEAIGAIEKAVLEPPARSVVVVGEEGVGKSVAIRKAARRLHVRGWTVFEATAAEAISGQRYIGEIEERVQQLAGIGRERRLAWVLPDLEEALTAGAYEQDPKGLIDRLMPAIERGDIVLLTEAQPSAWATLVQARPRLRALLRVVRLEPLDRQETLTLARSQLARLGTSMEPAAVREAADLAEQYLPGLAMPGNLLRLLLATVRRFAEAGPLPDAIVVADLTETLAEATGIPLDLLDQRRRLRLDEVRRFFDERILGQPEAVECLVERIAMMKAGLTDPTRPQGVFLLVGPTGTGKTELAKALAEYLFGSSGRMIRLDMSEYQTAESLERLLAGPQAPESSGLITAIRKQPFSVLLLDEFEKAHHNIWDLFLQLFDDGRLTDRGGKIADFRHSVVLLAVEWDESAIELLLQKGFTEDSGRGRSSVRSSSTSSCRWRGRSSSTRCRRATSSCSFARGTATPSKSPSSIPTRRRSPRRPRSPRSSRMTCGSRASPALRPAAMASSPSSSRRSSGSSRACAGVAGPRRRPACSSSPASPASGTHRIASTKGRRGTRSCSCSRRARTPRAAFRGSARSDVPRLGRAARDGHPHAATPARASALLAVSGFAAYVILRSESGLHLLERPAGKKSFDRVAARVQVVPQPSIPASELPGGLEAQAAEALRESMPTAVVRRSTASWQATST